MRPFVRTLLVVLLLAPPAWGKPPRVVADIAPVHSLVAMVMAGVATPDLILRADASPHANALRPSQARALQGADLVVWVGPGLTPWLEKPLRTLAPQSERLELLTAPETKVLALRSDKENGGKAWPDPHAWLDPENGRIWLGLIADRLARLDPENAPTYRANAVIGQAALTALQAEIAMRLTAMQGQPYVAYHDALQYFEVRFGLTPVGAVTASDASAPGPAALARLRDKSILSDVACAFTETQADPDLLIAATGRADVRVIPLDIMGRGSEPGPGLYAGVLGDMARAFAGCGDAQ
jgi:zinc transport system substrate-binding protein